VENVRRFDQTLLGRDGAIKRAVMAIVVVMLVVGMTAGCGKDGGSGSGASPTSSSDTEEQMRQFVKCMREHGVDMPDPGPGASAPVAAPSADRAKIEKAEEACKQYTGGGVLHTPDTQMLEQMRLYAKCMREHGVDMPDPDPDDSGRAVIADPNDPSLKAAQEACKDKLPQGAQPGGAP
jgi:hypothetical protein